MGKPRIFKKENIEECSDDEAIQIERYYINYYDTVNKGLNITYGNGQFGIKGSGFSGRFEKGNSAWKTENRKWKKVR